MNRDVERVLEQIKSCLRYGGARFLYALNTNTALFNISFSLSGERESGDSVCVCVWGGGGGGNCIFHTL